MVDRWVGGQVVMGERSRGVAVKAALDSEGASVGGKVRQPSREQQPPFRIIGGVTSKHRSSTVRRLIVACATR